MPDIQLQPLPNHSMQGDVFVDTDGMVDAAGNRFSLLAQAVPANGNDTYITLYKITPQGTFISWVFRPSQGQKIDKANLLRSGNDVIVECITHAITSNKPRLLMKESAVVQGVFVTTASYEGEEGGAGAWQPDGQPPQPPQEAGMTKDEFVAALNTPSDPLAVALGKTIKNKSREAISTEKVLTENNGQHYFYQFFKDRLYEVFAENAPGFWAWLVERVKRP
jgi:hypothetical protein